MVFLYIYTLMLIISFTLKLGNKAKIVFKKTDSTRHHRESARHLSTSSLVCLYRDTRALL